MTNPEHMRKCVRGGCISTVERPALVCDDCLADLPIETRGELVWVEADRSRYERAVRDALAVLGPRRVMT